MELKKLMEHISIIPDYRQAWKVEHKLSDILLLTICAVISGAESWEDIEDFGETHLDFLKQYGDFENGIPVHDTIARVVSCISPAKFHECFINWMRDCHASDSVLYTHLRAHETEAVIVCCLLLAKKTSRYALARSQRRLIHTRLA
ncbi:ISAs1 family transposase, partial [Escherichia coli]|uniref:ISAs1 family transposase n=1 Tax=Escherichia coli TaxID=562 RepID=UPI00201A4671